MKLQGSVAVAAMAAGIAAFPQNARAEEDERGGMRLIAGYQYLSLDHSFAHDTHPDDDFLPGAGTPGSAGTTQLDGGGFLTVGVGLWRSLSEASSFTADLVLLAGPRDEMQNANDSRPAEAGAFVYTKALGLVAALAVARDFGGVEGAIEAQVGGVWIEDGWDRFSQDEGDESTIEGLLTIGPRLAIPFGDFSIEASAFAGTHQGGQARLVLRM